jgi:hypothetical protein
MAIVLKDRVKVLATTTGTGTFTLGSAVTGFQNFSVIGDGNSTYYTIAAQTTPDWEVGIGTYTASGTLLSRDTILESSNGGAAVDFPAGTKDVFVTYPAERSVYLDSAGSYPVQNTFNTLNATTAVLTAGTISTTPASGTDIVNKTYVDTIAASGIHFHTPVRVESPTALTVTYNNGTSGVGATLTNAGTQVALVIDGITLSVSDRVLIYTQTDATQNGVYVVSNTGSVSTNWVLTRATDADSYGVSGPDTLSEGSTFFVTSGNTGAGETYTCNTTGTITFGTTNITFAQISSAQIYSAGTGLTLTNTTFSITNTGTAGTYGSASAVPVFVTNAQGQVTSVTNTSIAIASGAVSGLAASATTDTTNASNITTGTLGTGRISGSYTGITGVGTLAAGTWNGSTIAANYGGTGYSSYTVGDLLYSDTSSTLAKLADVAVGNALISGGVAAAPSWGKIGLATHVSGTLPVANGGTGATTLTGVLKGNGTSAVTASNVNLTSEVTGTLPVANGGTGITSLGSGVATFLGTPSSANLAAAVTGETGSGALVFATSPTLVTPALGTPSSGTLTNATGLPIVNGTTGTLSVARGGTGATTLTANNVLLGNGTSAPQVVAPGTTGNVLTSNGTTWTSAAPAPSAGTLQAVATGSLSDGSTVIINADGTVSAVSGSNTTVFDSNQALSTSAAYDASNNRVVITYADNGNSNYGTAIVGTVSGGTITFGTAVVFESVTIASSTTATVFDSSNNKVVICYRGTSSYGRAIVGTVSGTSISFGTAVDFEVATTVDISATYNSTNNRVVIAYRDSGNSNYGTAIVGTVSGTSISFGTAVVFESAFVTQTSTTYDSTNNRVVIAYRDGGNSNYGTAIVGTVSGTSISFGTAVVFESADVSDISATYNSTNNRVVIAYADVGNSNYGTAIVGTVSGTSISFGTAVVFESADTNSTQSISATYDVSANKVLISYTDVGNSSYATAVVGTVSGTSISFGTPYVISTTSTAYFASTYDSTNQKVVVAYNNSTSGVAVPLSSSATQLTSLTTENYIGISNAAYTNGQTATIQIVGSVDDAQAGLTAGQSYYVLADGSLGLTAATPSVFAGTAVSATKLIVKG